MRLCERMFLIGWFGVCTFVDRWVCRVCGFILVYPPCFHLYSSLFFVFYDIFLFNYLSILRVREIKGRDKVGEGRSEGDTERVGVSESE